MKECVQQSSDGEQGGAEGECGRPLLAENVETDGTSLRRDVRVPNLRVKPTFFTRRRSHTA